MILRSHHLLLLFLLKYISCNIENPDAHMSCTSDNDCDQKWIKWKIPFVCCVTVSCNDATKFYDVSSGCAAQRHCESKKVDNQSTSHFAGACKCLYAYHSSNTYSSTNILQRMDYNFKSSPIQMRFNT